VYRDVNERKETRFYVGNMSASAEYTSMETPYYIEVQGGF